MSSSESPRVQCSGSSLGRRFVRVFRFVDHPSSYDRCVVSSMCVPHRGQWVSMDTVPLGRENEECCEEGVCFPRLFHVLCVPPSMHYMHCMSVGLGRKEES